MFSNFCHILRVFKVKDKEVLDPDFLYLWFNRPEFDRYARFHSWGSTRESFDYEDMERVLIPLPDIDTQRAIVRIHHCASESQKIYELANKLSKEICPLLMQNLEMDS